MIIPSGEQQTIDTGITMIPPLNGNLQIRAPSKDFNVQEDTIYNGETNQITITVSNNNENIINQ